MCVCACVYVRACACMFTTRIGHISSIMKDDSNESAAALLDDADNI